MCSSDSGLLKQRCFEVASFRTVHSRCLYFKSVHISGTNAQNVNIQWYMHTLAWTSHKYAQEVLVTHHWHPSSDKLWENIILFKFRFQKLCDLVCELLLEESNVQPVSTPVTVCGDIHGQVGCCLSVIMWLVEYVSIMYDPNDRLA